MATVVGTSSMLASAHISRHESCSGMEESEKFKYREKGTFWNREECAHNSATHLEVEKNGTSAIAYKGKVGIHPMLPHFYKLREIKLKNLFSKMEQYLITNFLVVVLWTALFAVIFQMHISITQLQLQNQNELATVEKLKKKPSKSFEVFQKKKIKKTLDFWK